MNTDQYKDLPPQLKALKQWVGYRLEEPDKPRADGKKAKKLKNPRTGGNAKTNTPTTWGTFEETVAAVDIHKFDGIGIVFANGICGVDIDKCIGTDGTLSELAQDVIQIMDSYTELSPSGTGIHILFSGKVEQRLDLYIKNPKRDMEIYDVGSPRFFTVTGNPYGELKPLQERTEQVKTVQQKYMQRPKKEPAKKQGTPTTIKLSDEEVLSHARAASNADRFNALWSGDTSGNSEDDSSADMALCSLLAFWCGTNADQIDRLFRQSGLMRDKWEREQSGTTYGAITVQKAIDDCPNTYNPNSSQYIEEKYCLYRRTGQNEKKYLANFLAYPLEAIVKDNGVDVPKPFITISGQGVNGIPLPPVTLPWEQFSSMNWLNQSWDFFYRIAPGNGNRDFVRDYIQSQAASTPRKTIYTHTGFRVINENLCYLYHGGAIGTDNVECELAGDLSRYTFTPTQGISERDAIQEVMNLFKIAPPEISYPLLAFTYLAPLNYFLKKAGISADFCIFTIGTTGSFKTALSKLYLAHFHTYSGRDEPPPTSFRGTANAIEKMQFDLKDMPLLVDDYHPTTTKEKKRMDDIVQCVARGSSDRSGRARMNSDTSLRATFTPRGLTILTGEDTPDISQSGLARYYFIKFEKGDVPVSDLTERQRHGLDLNVAMQGFIKWLIQNADGLPKQLKEDGEKLLQSVNIANSHARTATTITCLQLALQCFAEYALSVGVFTQEQAQAFCDKAAMVFMQGGKEQAAAQAEESPVSKFLITLDGILQSQLMLTEEWGALAKDCIAPTRRLGYHDQQYYYLFPEQTYNAVRQAIEAGGCDTFVSKNKVYSDLAKAGLIEMQGGKNTVVRRINDTTPRFLKLKKSALDGLKEFDENEQ